MRPRAAELATVDAVERELDRCLTELRQAGPDNLLARSSIEYRIRALRDRKRVLERVAP
jgi:hypothetical protein